MSAIAETLRAQRLLYVDVAQSTCKSCSILIGTAGVAVNASNLLPTPGYPRFQTYDAPIGTLRPAPLKLQIL